MSCSKSYYKSILTPLKSKYKTFDFVGFDVETYNKNGVQSFYFGGIYYYNKGKEVYKVYFERQELINELLRLKYKGKYIVATNLSFDYSTLFYGTKQWNDINLIWRGSDLLMATYKLKNKHGQIRFIDTMNYVGFGVKKLGEIIGEHKLKSPSYMGQRKARTKEEIDYFIKYNKQDCKISCDFMYFLQNGVNEIGGELKITIASTSLDTYRRAFQKRKWIQESFQLKDDTIRDFIQKGYYGGRTEVYTRGKHYNMNYYDINSLYPSMMLKSLPNPNSIKEVHHLHEDNILYNEGVSDVIIQTPKTMRYPILPIKDKQSGKLIFPLGTFRGVYNHNELRYAIQKGYKINKIYKQYIYTSTFKPFKKFIKNLYNKRLDYKNKNSPMELVQKLLMNSLYGKFAQNKRQKVELTNLELVSQEEKERLLLYTDGDLKDNYHIEIKEEQFNGSFVFPILSSYITSLARITMHQYIEKYNAVYCDTDSIVTSQELPNSKELGKMKLESKLPECEFIKPKMYKMKFEGGEEVIKMKGINRAIEQDFINAKEEKTIYKEKLSKVRESIRRGFEPNTKMKIPKKLSLQDDKRIWSNNESKPIKINQT